MGDGVPFNPHPPYLADGCKTANVYGLDDMEQGTEAAQQ